MKIQLVLEYVIVSRTVGQGGLSGSLKTQEEI